MGPGILTRYSRQVLGGFLALFVLVAAGVLYLRFRSPVGGASPYEPVSPPEEYGIEMVADEVMYTGQTAPVQVTVRNTSESGWLEPNPYRPLEWVLEVQVDGQWYSMRTPEKRIRWEWFPEDKSLNSEPSGVVKVGEEQIFLCYIGDYYRLPLRSALYRIVFPDMSKVRPDGGVYREIALAAEFGVIP